MTIHFIGAGPGAPDLITVRGRDLIARCPVCLYAGSLVPQALLDHCPPGARVVDTAPLSLDEIVEECRRATDDGHDVARLHSGDLSIWSALGEQLRRLDAAGIVYTVTPGVPSFAAAAAIPGTIVSRVAPVGADGRVTFGHPSGVLNVGAEAREEGGQWVVTKVMMSRSARRLMEGWVRVPA